nr:protein O-mannosyl-transferase 2-like [Penaeus vannamei]
MPYKVVWDEAHFGKMVSWYINRTFFFDVHPVGGKLLLTLFGYLGGYNGTHSFESPDKPYDGYDGIMAMRVGCALMGAALVPLGFHTVWTLTRSLPASTFAAGLITFVIHFAGPASAVFILASFHGFTFMHEADDRSFSKQWWFAYLYTGAMLGCVMSVKFVGLFIVLVVGLYVALDLWQKLGELDRPLLSVAAHFYGSCVDADLLPAAIYVGVFFIHDQLLFKKNSSRGGRRHVQPGFQMRLKTNFLNNLTQPKKLAYGNVITLKNTNLAGIYLHSHNFTYPQHKVGKNKQQLTGFGAKDVNNYFKVLFPRRTPTWAILSTMNLTDPALAAKINRAFDENPEATVSNPNITMWQLWSVHIVGASQGVRESARLKGQVRLHPLTCALTWTREKLPLKWYVKLTVFPQGFNQQEISCSKNVMDDYTNWMVEINMNPHLKNESFSHLESGFFSRMIETHRVMTFINGRLKPEGEDRYNSHRPWMWPFCLKSQVWFDVAFRIVLLGNPIIFWINLVFLMVVPGLIIAHYYRLKSLRGAILCTVQWHGSHATAPYQRLNLMIVIMIFAISSSTFTNGLLMFPISPNICGPFHLYDHIDKYPFFYMPRFHTNLQPSFYRTKREDDICLQVALPGYLFHYIPFYTMDRILYYHHYFPALQFSSMLTAVVFGYVLESLDTWLPIRKARLAFHWATGVFFAIVLYSFHLYCYVGYGHPTVSGFNPDNSTFRNIRFFDSWEI